MSCQLKRNMHAREETELRIGRSIERRWKKKKSVYKIPDLLINYTLLKCVTEVCEM